MEFKNEETYREEIVQIRRWLHSHGEPSFEEIKTSEFIRNYLQKLEIPFQRFGKTAVVADIDTGREGLCVAYRADMDALRIREETGAEYQSLTDGMMHACGHDVHTAMVLLTAKYIKENIDEFKGKARFIFQHAEELPPGGAVELADAGVLEGVDFIYGVHCDATEMAGDVILTKGVLMASADKFVIEITGKGGHAASPHTSIDAVMISAQIINALQTIVSRNIHPIESGVVSIGCINGGKSFNVIAENVRIEGTARSLSEENRDLIENRITAIAQGIAKIHGASCKLDYLRGYPIVVNDPDAVENIENAAVRLFGEKRCMLTKTHRLGADDFAYYLQKKKGAMFHIGTRPSKEFNYPLHNPHFDVDETMMLDGVKIFAELFDSQ